MLVKYSIEREKMKENIMSLTTKNKALSKINETLLESNNYYKNSRKKVLQDKEKEKILA